MALRAVLWCAVSTKTQAADERDSLPTQEADGRALCEREGYQIVDVLKVAGHSRRYIDIHECARDMRLEGIDAFDRLLRHWDARDFDMLIVRDGDRFARTQSLHAYIVERTISIGAKIHSLADGIIDESNFRLWIAMGGYRAAGEIDSLVKKRQMGFDARARRGLPVNAHIVRSHRLLRDERTGKALRVVINESRRREWQDLATLILEGIAWKYMEAAMFDRFGHGSPLNEPYQPHHYYRIVSTPSFWGHTARHFKESPRGPWVREPGHPAPDGVLVVYNVFEPVYTGELAAQIKAELSRREALKGNARPQTTLRFTGLFVCAECGYGLVYARSKGYAALRCASRYEQSSTHPNCETRRYLSEKRAQNYIDQCLRRMLGAGDPAAFLPSNGAGAAPDFSSQVAGVERDIADVEKQIQRMILKQASADNTLHDHYEQALYNASSRLRALKERLKDLQRHMDATDHSTAQRRAYREIEALSVDGFWEQEDRFINQCLHALMAKKRFLVEAGDIIGTADVPKRKKRY